MLPFVRRAFLLIGALALAPISSLRAELGLARENFGILGDLIRDGELAIHEFVAAGRAAGGEIILRGLNVVTDTVERDDGQSVHFCRRMPRLSSAIVSVCISPRV
jgi:hypothetical protein